MKWPLVKRRELEEVRRAAAEREKRLRESQSRELEEATKHAASVVERARFFRWDERPDGQYAITIRFDPRAMGMRGGMEGRELDFLADMVAGQVAREIRSSKFLQESRERRYERQDNFGPSAWDGPVRPGGSR